MFRQKELSKYYYNSFFSSVKGKFFLTFSRGNYRMRFADLDQGTEIIIFELILTTF
jgi:hypothetical protein